MLTCSGEIQKEYGSFSDYLWHWTEGAVIYEKGQLTPLCRMRFPVT